MAKRMDKADKLVIGALAIAAESGWSKVRPRALSRQTGLPLLDIFELCPDRRALLALISTTVDRKMLAAARPEEDEPARDRLFDVLMTRLDVLNAHRAGFRAILLDLPRNPARLVAMVPRVDTSMRWVLEAAGLGTSGVVGAARVRGLSILYCSVLRHWVDDDTEDMSRTMAALDQRLARAEQWANSLEPGLDRLDGLCSAISARRSRSRTDTAPQTDEGEAADEPSST